MFEKRKKNKIFFLMYVQHVFGFKYEFVMVNFSEGALIIGDSHLVASRARTHTTSFNL